MNITYSNGMLSIPLYPSDLSSHQFLPVTFLETIEITGKERILQNSYTFFKFWKFQPLILVQIQDQYHNPKFEGTFPGVSPRTIFQVILAQTENHKPH